MSAAKKSPAVRAREPDEIACARSEAKLALLRLTSQLAEKARYEWDAQKAAALATAAAECYAAARLP